MKYGVLFVFALMMAFFFLLAIDAKNGMTGDGNKKTTLPVPADATKDEGRQNVSNTQKEEGSKVVAYYFHGNVRCPTCMKLEEYSGEAVNQGFSESISKGDLEFRSINVDEEANSHFIKDYGLVSRSLVLSKLDNGKEVKWKNLDQIWTLVRSHDKFIEYVRDETRKMMEDKNK